MAKGGAAKVLKKRAEFKVSLGAGGSWDTLGVYVEGQDDKDDDDEDEVFAAPPAMAKLLSEP